MQHAVPSRHWFIAFALSVALGLPGHRACAQATAFDATFGTNGRTFTTFSAAPTTDAAVAAVLQPDGKLVVAGQGAAGLELARYTTTGALDATFGKVTLQVPAATGSPCYYPAGTQSVVTYGLCLQTDGKIVVVGSASVRASFVARFLPTGALDTNFGNGGIAYLCGGTVAGYAVRVGQQPNGNLAVLAHLVGAGSLAPGPGRATVCVVPADGKISPAYLPYAGGDYWRFVDGFVDDTGRAVAVGYENGYFITSVLSSFRLILVRRLPDGQADTSFGTAGVAALNQLNGQPVGGRAVAALPTGQFLVLGVSNPQSSTPAPFLVRYTATGTLDTSFGTGGIVSLGEAKDGDFKAMRVQADGKIVLAGTRNGDFALRRLLPTGQPDLAYGQDSYLTLNEDTNDQLNDLLLQPDGKAVAVGYAASSATGSNSRFVVLRALATGTSLATTPGQLASAAGELRVSPNPTTGSALRVELEWPLPTGAPVEVELLSPLGQVVARASLSASGPRQHTATLAGALLPAGLYIVRARATNGRVLTTRMALRQ